LGEQSDEENRNRAVDNAYHWRDRKMKKKLEAAALSSGI
jgi:hypothetical protein